MLKVKCFLLLNFGSCPAVKKRGRALFRLERGSLRTVCTIFPAFWEGKELHGKGSSDSRVCSLAHYDVHVSTASACGKGQLLAHGIGCRASGRALLLTFLKVAW